ncbi:NUDIX hydrolase [Shewanella sp. HL-SH2]|uniref:NUDIX hydrolase n=1 Tax=Shewanella sp. HL-SH2 TaxID=3436238 RepID=UPI003EC010F3
MSPRYKPNTTVASVIHCSGKFLLVEEWIDGQKRYNQPAGHLEANETIIAACKREVLEETGLNITPSGLVGIYQFTAANDVEFVRFSFCVELPVQVTAIPQDSVITATHWFTRDEISSKSTQMRSPLVLKSIDDFLDQQGQHYPLDVLNADYF